jgi:hypothetical protein
MRIRVAGTLSLLVLVAMSQAGCMHRVTEHTLPELNTGLELEARLEAVNFSIVESDLDAVAVSWSALEHGEDLPRSWPVEFAGTEVELPPIDPDEGVGIAHTDGRVTAVYPMPEPRLPAYGEVLPLAVAHYHIPDRAQDARGTGLDIVLLMVCFQADPSGSLAGIGVRSVGVDGVEISAPFAVALRPEQLRGKFFYDEFIAGGEKQQVAARPSWDRGFLLLTRPTEDVVLSTYLPWS